MKFYSLLLLIFVSSCAQNGENTITIIPAKYTGPICINFKIKDGTPKEYESKNRVYRIGKDGVLNTQFEAIFDKYQFNKYYYEDENGKRQEIAFFDLYDKSKNNSKESVYIFGEEHTGIGGGVDGNGKEFSTAPSILFYVGSYENIEKKANEQMQFGFKNQKIIDPK